MGNSGDGCVFGVNFVQYNEDLTALQRMFQSVISVPIKYFFLHS